MSKTTINELAKLLKNDESKGDSSQWGVVQSLITDGEGTVTGYNVSLGGSSGTIETAKGCGAKVGDTVFLIIRANGEVVPTNTKGGDTDIQDVATDLADNYYDKTATDDRIDEKIEEIEIEGSYEQIEWLATSTTDQPSASTTGSWTIPSLTSTNKYLWQRNVTWNGDTRDYPAWRRCETMDGVYVFMDTVSNSGHTMIQGGRINISDAIYSGNHSSIESTSAGAYLGTDGISYAETVNGEPYLVTIKKPSSSDNKYISIKQLGGSEWYNMFYVTSTGSIGGNDLSLDEGIVCGDIDVSDVTCASVTASGAITTSGYLIGDGLEIPSHLKVSSIGSGTGDTLRYNSSGYIVKYSGSARRWKRDIKAVESENLDPHKLYDIDVIQFKYKNDHIEETDEQYDKDIIGFIADQVEEVYPIAVTHNADGEVSSWDEFIMIPAMLKLIQEQHSEIESLKARVSALESEA